MTPAEALQQIAAGQANGLSLQQMTEIAQAALAEHKRMFTVVLLYPDYATGDFGADIYVDAVDADDPHDAAEIIQQRAFDANGGASVSNPVNDPDDFRPIAVIAGDVYLELSALDF